MHFLGFRYENLPRPFISGATKLSLIVLKTCGAPDWDTKQVTRSPPDTLVLELGAKG